MNFSSLIVFLALCFVVTLAIRSIYKDKKAGKASCGGSCGGSCHCGPNDMCQDPKKFFDTIRKEQFSK